MYSVRGRISSIQQAVVLLGFREIRSIALAMSVFNAFHVRSAGAYFNRHKFWEHSLFTGVAARIMAKKYRQNENEAFIGGLIHDIGKVVFDRYLPKTFAKVINRVDRDRCTMEQAEFEEFGFTHATIGMKLLEKWNFPGKIAEVVGLHHAPWQAESFQAVTSLTYLANILCKIDGYPSYVSERVPTLDEFLESRGADFLRSNGFKIDEESLCTLGEELLTEFNRTSELTQVMAA